MKKIFLFLLLAAFFTQFSLLPVLISSAQINLVLLLVISLCVVYSFRETFLWVLVAGALFDIFSLTGFGVYLLTFLCVAFLMDSVSRTILPERRGTLMPFVIILSSQALFSLTSYVLQRMLRYYGLSTIKPVLVHHGYWQELVLLLVTSLVGLLIYKGVWKLEKTIGQGRMELKLINH